MMLLFDNLDVSSSVDILQLDKSAHLPFPPPTAKFNDQIINVKQMVDNLKILQAERTLKNHADSESDSQVR
jgi:hypothetical protein